ncbi:MAG TPA: alpha-glucan family phosphorylase [Candidatus Deferrimicrobium sp.]|nr:alpha-glucan family phosphorylase [Candidatus Deferrimicrobium sp.]
MELSPKIAYFSMEIALESDIPTYSGGLGILAGDTLRSCADLEIPIVGVTLVYNNGYFYQLLDNNGNQIEKDVRWEFSDLLERVPVTVKVTIQGKDVIIGAWVYEITGPTDYRIPIYLLDTYEEENEDWQKNFTRILYDATPFERICQEIILGIGGLRMLSALGYKDINVHHMNEGHAAFLTLELLKDFKGNVDEVKKRTVFTTHTPVPAGQDRFSYDLVQDVFRNDLLPQNIREFAGQSELNMTQLCLSLSKYANGVSKKHREITQKMFPNFRIDSITNAVHSPTWINPLLGDFFSEFFPNWKYNPKVFEKFEVLENDELWRRHQIIKNQLLDYQKSHSWVLFDNKLLTIGFCRRITPYKRPTLIFKDLDRLGKICKNKVQFIFAGKTHPRDGDGKQLIRDIFSASEYLWDKYRVGLTFLDNYDMNLSKLIVPGVDLWLNTPKRYQEASGTSGMKAAHNGVLNFSVLDGWWLEGYSASKGIAGWSIGPGPDDPKAEQNDDYVDSQDFYNKLESEIIPLYYKERDNWITRMKHAISLIAYFNTNRMVMEYADKSWLLKQQTRWISNF